MHDQGNLDGAHIESAINLLREYDKDPQPARKAELVKQLAELSAPNSTPVLVIGQGYGNGGVGAASRNVSGGGSGGSGLPFPDGTGKAAYGGSDQASQYGGGSSNMPAGPPMVIMSKRLMEIMWTALEAYSNESYYYAPRTGGVLAGCPRGPEPDPKELTEWATYALREFRKEVSLPGRPATREPEIRMAFQDRCHAWIMKCFGSKVTRSRRHRRQRFMEEAIELAQACGATEYECTQLVRHVFARPTGEVAQEVGGVLTTLAVLCNRYSLDMAACANTELARAEQNIDRIREKQAAKQIFRDIADDEEDDDN